MYLSLQEILETPKIRRLNIINSISGIKPGNLIGTRSKTGQSNLAIISSVVHLGSNPPFLGYVLRPVGDVPRHTFENIGETGYFTVNHIGPDFTERAHYTSAKFDKNVSEFEACGLTEEYQHGFHAPFVKESAIKMGLRHVESIPIKSSNTLMIVGKIEHLMVPDTAIDEAGQIDLETAGSVGISGLNSYYNLKKIGEFPYARVSEKPDFEQP